MDNVIDFKHIKIPSKRELEDMSRRLSHYNRKRREMCYASIENRLCLVNRREYFNLVFERDGFENIKLNDFK